MHRKKRAAMLSALLGAALLTACYKGNGTESLTFPQSSKKEVPVKVNSEVAAELDAAFTDASVSEDAETETPFPFDTPEEPRQDILLVLLYDNTDNYNEHRQSVNYIDKAGGVYRYRDAVDADGDWLSPLQAHYSGGANPVSLLSDAERETVWYLAAHAKEYAALPEKSRDAGRVAGETALWLIDSGGTPVRLGCWADESFWRDSSEVTAFLDWFRIFFHYGFSFSG